MSQLCAQSIRELCEPYKAFSLDHRFQHRAIDKDTGEMLPMISPFVGEKTIRNGLSYGLSVTSYDLRIAHDLTLEPHPGHLLLEFMDAAGSPHDVMLAYHKAMHTLRVKPNLSLAYSMEKFALPFNVAGRLCDKSTRARTGLSCFNTLFDPGFIGVATLELVNLSAKTIIIRMGDPIAQMTFTWLDEVSPGYSGKYQNQPDQAVEAIMEEEPTS